MTVSENCCYSGTILEANVHSLQPHGKPAFIGKDDPPLRSSGLMLTVRRRLMGALTNNGRKLANFAGFYKGIQSAGNAVASRTDALKAPFMNEFASNWALLLGSLLIAAPLIFMKVPDTVPLEEDLKFSDETLEEVAPTHAPHEINEKA